MAERMANIAGNQTGWGSLAEGQALKEAIGQNKDAVAVTAQAESDNGNTGVPWVGGNKAGGRGQPPIRVVSEVTKAGFNLLNNRSASDASTVAPNDCNSGMLCGTWRSPDEAAAFANRVLGEVQQQTCETCTKSTTTAGVGLTPLIQEEYEAKLEALHELISGSKPPSTENLNLAGSNSMPITRGVITALRDEPDPRDPGTAPGVRDRGHQRAGKSPPAPARPPRRQQRTQCRGERNCYRDSEYRASISPTRNHQPQNRARAAQIPDQQLPSRDHRSPQRTQRQLTGHLRRGSRNQSS